LSERTAIISDCIKHTAAPCTTAMYDPIRPGLGCQINEQLAVFMSQAVCLMPGDLGVASMSVSMSVTVSIALHAPSVAAPGVSSL